MESRIPGYLAVKGGLKYAGFLHHFQKQAEGVGGKRVIIPGTSGFRGKNKTPQSLVMVNLANQQSKDKDPRPTLKVVDPTEAAKQRTMSDLKRTEGLTQAVINKKQTNRKRPHSQPRPRSSKNSGQSTEKRIKTKISRAKDIFD
jgi:hypothetical protein